MKRGHDKTFRKLWPFSGWRPGLGAAEMKKLVDLKWFWRGNQ